MSKHDPGSLTTSQVHGTSRYRCSRGHVFDDHSFGSGMLPSDILMVASPKNIAGTYCGLCIREFFGQAVGSVELAEDDAPLVASLPQG